MAEKPINLEAIRQAEATLEKALEDYPELREDNPERKHDFEAWFAALDEEDTAYG